MKTSLILITLLISCGQQKPDSTSSTPVIASESDINNFIKSFFKDAENHGIQLNMDFISKVSLEDSIDNNPSVLGKCSGTAHSQILQFKKDQNIDVMKSTVYHELGHCMLGEQHSDNDEDIMYYSETGKPLNQWEESVDTLFNNANQDYLKWTTK